MSSMVRRQASEFLLYRYTDVLDKVLVAVLLLQLFNQHALLRWT